jgi:hypothetical protein
MAQEGETKTCKMCGVAIPAVAKKCPYCHHWQRVLCLHHPLIVLLLVGFPLIGGYAALMASVMPNVFREWERFPTHADEVTITSSTMEFGEDTNGPQVIIVGIVDNSGPVEWKDVRFEAAFYNPKGALFDAGQEEQYTWRLPAEERSSFKISFRRQFPEKEYASHKVRVVSAVDSRHWP